MDEEVHHKYEVASTLYKEGRFEEALALFEELSRDIPDSKHVIYSRGSCLVALNRVPEARIYLDELSRHHGTTAKQLRQKLESKMRDKLRENVKAAKQPDHAQEARAAARAARRRKSTRKPLMIISGVVVVLLIVAGLAVLKKRQDAANQPVLPKGLVAEGDGADQYGEPVVFYPAASDRSFTLAMFYGPAASESTGKYSQLEAKAGDKLAANWSEMRSHGGKGLQLLRPGTEPIADTSRDQMTHTTVFPRQGTSLQPPFAGTQMEYFFPKPETTLKTLKEILGEPVATEQWHGHGKEVGLTGEVLWWGNIGVAANPGGEITHVLMRSLPEPRHDEPAADNTAGSPSEGAPAAPASGETAQTAPEGQPTQ